MTKKLYEKKQWLSTGKKSKNIIISLLKIKQKSL